MKSQRRADCGPESSSDRATTHGRRGRAGPRRVRGAFSGFRSSTSFGSRRRRSRLRGLERSLPACRWAVRLCQVYGTYSCSASAQNYSCNRVHIGHRYCTAVFACALLGLTHTKPQRLLLEPRLGAELPHLRKVLERLLRRARLLHLRRCRGLVHERLQLRGGAREPLLQHGHLVLQC